MTHSVASASCGIVVSLLIATAIVGGAVAGNGAYMRLSLSLPPVPEPDENPITEEKRILGKMLFWDEQLSSDNTIACGTCHYPSAGGSDFRLGVHPGPDGLFGVVDPDTGLDDVIGSPGVISTDAAGDYQPVMFFGLDVQVTGRSANPAIMAMYASELFWDGRATDDFKDPLDGTTQILAAFAALESQSVQPILSSVEMAHEGRTWGDVTDKLGAVIPLALASNLPPDVESALVTEPVYADLFEAAFGDSEITPARIGMAIATYERTLVPDQTPYDLGTMTEDQEAGFLLLQDNTVCFNCHVPPLFTDNEFHNIGLRPAADDEGRRAVTGAQRDFGRFKTPTLRNAGLKPSMMHAGWVVDIQDSIDYYNAGSQDTGHTQFTEHQDRIPPGGGNYNQINMPEFFQPNVIDFIANALTDPRAANEQFPFDRPTLHSEIDPPNPAVSGPGRAGTDGLTPRMIAVVPPNIGNGTFRVGVSNALSGVDAWVILTDVTPVGDEITSGDLFGPYPTGGGDPGDGYGTHQLPIPMDAALIGQTMWAQWRVNDPAAQHGVALSPIAEFIYFCNRCPADECAADFNGDGTVDTQDFLAFLNAWSAQDSRADFNQDGEIDTRDFIAFLNAWVAGC